MCISNRCVLAGVRWALGGMVLAVENMPYPVPDTCAVVLGVRVCGHHPQTMVSPVASAHINK